ncbi:hypothetical protein M8J76_012230 [Diaphorina citri]|nr:hypothetical protein M8J76_012230 [Diaphorina citri]
MEEKEAIQSTEQDYSFMIFGNNPVQNINESSNAQEMSNFHNEFHQGTSSSLHLSHQMTDPLTSINENTRRDVPNISATHGTHTPNSCRELSLLLPLEHKSSQSFQESFNFKEYSDKDNDHQKNGSLLPLLGNDKLQSRVILSSVEDCESIVKSITTPLSFNINSSSGVNVNKQEVNTCNAFESNQVPVMHFNPPKIMSSEYQGCQNQAHTFSQINSSNDKTFSFTKCLNFVQSKEPTSNNKNNFENILSEETNSDFVQTEHQYINENDNFEKKIYHFDSNKDVSVDSKNDVTNGSLTSSQEISRVHDHLLTKNTLVPNEEIDKTRAISERNPSNIFIFDTNSSVNSRRDDLNFKGISKSEDVILFEENSIVKNHDVNCFENIIQPPNAGQNEDTIQDSSDIFDHIMNKQPEHAICPKNNIYSNQDISGDGLENIHIEHLNENSLSSIEINEKLSEDLLNKETNINLYTTNLTEYMQPTGRFNEPPGPNIRTSIDTSDSLINQNDDINNSCFSIEKSHSKQSQNVDLQNMCEKISNNFECGATDIFPEHLPALTNVFVENSTILNTNCNKSEIISTMDVTVEPKPGSETRNIISNNNSCHPDTTSIDTSDLSNIILNNDIFTLDTKNQSIQTIKETYNIGEENAALMIDNHADGLVERIFQVPPKPCLEHEMQHHMNYFTKQKSIEPERNELHTLKLIESNSMKTSQDSSEDLKCGNEILGDNELQSMDDISEHFNTKHVEMEINDLFNNGPEFTTTIRAETLSHDIQESSNPNRHQEIISDTSNIEKTSRSLQLASIHSIQEETVQHQNIVHHSNSNKTKKPFDSAKKKTKRKVCTNRDLNHTQPFTLSKQSVHSSVENNHTVVSIFNGMEVANKSNVKTISVQPENTIDIFNKPSDDSHENRNKVIESSQETKSLKLLSNCEHVDQNTTSECMEISEEFKEPRKRTILSCSHSEQMNEPPAKQIRLDSNAITNNELIEKLPQSCSASDFTEKTPAPVSSRSKKEQVLNKLKLILITNKDVNLNNELISLNEDEVLHNSHIVNEDSTEKSMTIDEDDGKSLIDNSKLLDEENETLMGSQMLENIEMFSNLSEYFNIDQNNELGQELSNEENTPNPLSSTENIDITIVSEIVEDKKSQTKLPKTVEVNKKKKLSCKQQVLRKVDDQKISEVIFEGESGNSDVNLKSNVKKKIIRSKILKNIRDKIPNKDDESISKEQIANKPKIIKQIFGKSSNKVGKTSNKKSTPQSHNQSLEDDSKGSHNLTVDKREPKCIVETYTKSLVEKIEDSTKIDSRPKSGTQFSIVSNKKDVEKTSKPRPISSRSRSNSNDSNHRETKKKSNVKPALPLVHDNPSQEKNESLTTFNQSLHLAPNKDSANKVLPIQNKKISVKSKAKKKSNATNEKSSVVPELHKSTQEVTQKPSKAKKTKTTPFQTTNKSLNAQVSHVSSQARTDSVSINKCLSDKGKDEIDNNLNIADPTLPPSDITENETVEVLTHKDIECQTDEPPEKELFILNKPSLSDGYNPLNDLIINDQSHPKFLYKTVANKFILLNEPLKEVAFPGTNITFSASETLLKGKNNVYYNGVNSLKENSTASSVKTVESFPSSCSTLINSVRSIEQAKNIDVDKAYDELQVIETYPVRNKEPSCVLNTKEQLDIALGSKHYETIPEVSNDHYLKEVRNNMVTNLKNKEKNNCEIAVEPKDIKQDIKKKPKYIIMKMNGEDKVYKLVDDPSSNEIAESKKISSKRLHIVKPSSKPHQVNKQQTNSIKPSIDHKSNVLQQDESIEYGGNTTFEHVVHSGHEKQIKTLLPRKNLAIDSNKTIQKLNNVEPLQNIAKSIAPMTAKTTAVAPKLTADRTTIKELINKVNAAKNRQNNSPIQSNVLLSQNKFANQSDSSTCMRMKEVDRNAKTLKSNQISNTKLITKPLPLSKTLSVPIKNKIVRIVPMYANKGPRRKSLEENQTNFNLNNNTLPLKQITSKLKDSQGNNHDTYKTIQIKNGDGMKTIVINNNKSQQDSSKSLLETNKLILDILHKNKIKTIILGCKNKEIFRKDLSQEETTCLEDGIRNANGHFVEEDVHNLNTIRTDETNNKTSQLNDHPNDLIAEEDSNRKIDATDDQKIEVVTPNKNRTFDSLELLKAIFKDKKSVAEDTNYEGRRLEGNTKIMQKKDDGKRFEDLNKVIQKKDQTLEDIPEASTRIESVEGEKAFERTAEQDQMEIDLVVVPVDGEEENEEAIGEEGNEEIGDEGIDEEIGKDKDAGDAKAVETLDAVCDIIKVYKCKRCAFTHDKKNAFVLHLKTAHDREFAVERTGNLGGDKVEGDTEEESSISQNLPVEQATGTGVKDREYKAWLEDPICDLKPCPLSTCGVKLASQTSLTIHAACHTSQGFKCYEATCGEVFTRWVTCTNHMHKAHSIDCDLIYCPVPDCDYVCNTKTRLCCHLTSHSKQKQHKCEQCGKMFAQKCQLANHRALHEKKTHGKVSGDRWYMRKQCLLCTKFYADIKCLKKHIREVHKRLKPFQCPVCGFTTGRKATLQLHVRQHTREKPYACPTCEFKTGDHNVLRKHVQRHMPVKKYQCTFCSYSCTERFRLKDHTLAKHNPGTDDDLSDRLSIVTFPDNLSTVSEEDPGTVYIQLYSPHLSHPESTPC